MAGMALHSCMQVSTHSRLKAAGSKLRQGVAALGVSTHSRLKAAGYAKLRVTQLAARFNTQPPEGGWLGVSKQLISSYVFQHTAA